MATYYQSPKRKGMDFWQAATGALLALFICVHLILEGSIVISPRLTDSIGWFLEYFWLAQIGAPVVVLLIVTHFVIAARKMPLRAGELKIFVAHSRAFKEAAGIAIVDVLFYDKSTHLPGLFPARFQLRPD